MKYRSDLYYKASQQKATPLIIAVVGSDLALRALGKVTPPESFYSNFPLQITEYGARVLTFGDYNESISENSEDMFLSLSTQTMDTYILTCDNADRFFTKAIGRGEEFLGGRFWLYQGFVYPGFSFSDYIQLFSGRIVDYTVDRSIFELTIDSAITAGFPGDDVEIPLERVYGLADNGTGTLVEDSLTYNELQTFWEAESWTHTYIFYKESSGVNDVLFNLTDDTTGNTRLEVGIDTNDNLYVKLTEDATGAPSYDTYTTSFTVAPGAISISVEFDANSGELTIASGDNSETFSTLEFTVLSSFGLAYAAYNITTDDGNNIYTTAGTGAIGTEAVRKYDALGNLLLTIQAGVGANLIRPRDVAVDDTGNIYVSDYSDISINVFDSVGNFIRRWEGSPSPFFYNWGIDIASSGVVYVSEVEGGGSNKIDIFSNDGIFLRTFGYIGEDAYAIAQSRDSRIVVVSSDTTVIGQVYNAIGSLLFTFGNSTDLAGAACVAFDLSENIYVGTTSGLFVYNANGVYLGEYASPSGKIEGVSVNADGNIVICINTGASTRTIQTLSFSSKKFDTSDLGGNNTMSAGDPVDGIIQEANVSGIGDLIEELTVVDGVYEEVIEEGEILTEYDILTEFVIPMTDQYSNPGDNQKNVALPLVYGDMIENSDLGAWVCPCIDSVNFVYCVAGWPVLPVAYGNTVSIYVDGVLQSSGYTFDDSNDYEGKGEVAIVDFTSDPGGVVTARCKGKWVNSSFPTNPIDIIEDLLDYVASQTGETVWQPDAASFAQGRAFCEANGYVAAGVIIQNNTIGFHINNILKSFLGSFSFTGNGKLKLHFLPLEYNASTVEDIQENEAIQYNLSRSLENVVKTIIINYAVSTVEIDRRFKGGSKTSHFRTYEGTYPFDTPYSGKTWELNFDWNRKTETVALLANRILEIYGVPNWVLNYTGQDFKFIPIDIFDGIEATLSTILDETFQPVESKVFKLREKTINLDNFTSSLVLYELRDVSLGAGVYIGSSPVYIGASPVYIGS